MTGGSGSRTYSWSKVSGYGNLISSSGNTADISYTAGQPRDGSQGTFACLVTDTVYGKTDTGTITITWGFSSLA